MSSPTGGLVVTVDRDLCQGHARCWGLDPDVFDIDDVGFAVPGRHLVPAGHEEAARQAALACPERAITVEEPTP